MWDVGGSIELVVSEAIDSLMISLFRMVLALLDGINVPRKVIFFEMSFKQVASSYEIG